MLGRIGFTLILTVMFLIGSARAQTAAISPTPTEKLPAKSNLRPTPTPAFSGEPFDKADVKTMAAKCVKLETEAGEIDLELFPESAPESVRNFLNLAATGAFDTTTFSRIVPGFVIQGGNIWTREGGVTPALGLRARRPLQDEPNRILHERGILSMARRDEPNTATTNFFILVDSASYLDGKFAAFGRVIKGMEIVDLINKMQVEGDKPVKPVRLRKASVFVCPALPTPQSAEQKP